MGRCQQFGFEKQSSARLRMGDIRAGRSTTRSTGLYILLAIVHDF